MHELRTYRDVIQALLEGEEVEFKSPFTDTWLPANSMSFAVQKLDENIGGEYRIKPQHSTLTNREVLTALLEGKAIQSGCIEEGENTPTKWEDVTYCPFFTTDDLDEPFNRLTWTEALCVYRIKPEAEIEK